jgi:hypothetical protein
MTVSGVYTAPAAIGIREDLEDLIYRIDPTETPAVSTLGKGKAIAKFHEWQIQRLAAANGSNAQLDGAVAPTAVATPTTRVGNRTQIMSKVASVSGGLQAVDTAGRANELSYQVLLKGLELKRDMEANVTQNGASQVDNGTLPGLSAGFESWLTTNTNRGAAGSSGGFSAGIVAAPTDGTLRSLSGQTDKGEGFFKSAIASTYTAGGKPSLIMLPPLLKQSFSGIAGIAINRLEMSKPKMASVVGAVDVYVSDFGQFALVPNLFMRTRVAIGMSPKFAAINYLRSMRNWQLAKVGDADQRQLLVEYTLKMANEAAHFIVADLSA